MTKRKLELKECVFIPEDLEPGIFYHSVRYRTSAHLCACGCGAKVVLPIKEGEWALTRSAAGFSVWPSVGSRELACRSHYVINGGELKWYPPLSDAEVAMSRQRDAAHREKLYHAAKPPLWARILDWLKRVGKRILRLS